MIFETVARRAYPSPMLMPRQDTVKDWLKALILWTALGLSLGLYYRVEAGDGRGWLLPFPEALGGALLFHFAEVSATSGIVALAWLASVVLAGFLWIATLSVLSPFFGGRRAHFSMALVRAGASAFPLLLGGAWLFYTAGQTGGGWQGSRMMDIAMGRNVMEPWAYLNWLFLGLASLSFLIQARLFMTAFDVKGLKALQHFLTGFIVLALIACGAGAAASIPLGLWLE